MEPDEGHLEAGSIRLNADNEVERYDGTDWKPYVQLPDDGSETLFRGENPDAGQERA